MSEANKRQVGGDHYQAPIQAWDFIHEHQLSYLEGCVVKYLSRFDKKGTPTQDLNKALHYIEKIEETDDGKMPMGRNSEFAEKLQDYCFNCGMQFGVWLVLQDVLMRKNLAHTTTAKQRIEAFIGWNLDARSECVGDLPPIDDGRVICGVFPHGDE